MKVFIATLSFLLLLSFPSITHADDCKKAKDLVSEGNKYLSSNPEKAQYFYSEAVTICPKSSNAHYNLGISLLNQKKYSDAISAFDNALKIRSNFPEAMIGKAFALVGGNIDTEKGMKLAKEALSLRPNDTKLAELVAMLDIDIDTPLITKIKNPDAIAVVIGNQHYINKDVPSVDYAIRDASTIKEYLIKTMGFREGNIIYETDATFAKFREIFGTENNHKGSLYNYIRADKSEVFIYYSGHGTYNTQSDKKEVYFVPADASPDAITLNGYPVDVFYKNLAKIKKELQPQKMTVVIDSCFSGGSEKGMLIKGSLMYVEVENPLMTMPDTVVFTSASGSQISSWYPEKRHSMFTYFFLKAIKDGVQKGSGKIAVKDIESYVKEEVPYYARKLYSGRKQTPEVFGDKNLLLLSIE